MMQEVKRTLAGVRKDLGLSQKQMAEKLGITTLTYSRYERYETTIPTKIAFAIATMAGIENPRSIKFY